MRIVAADELRRNEGRERLGEELFAHGRQKRGWREHAQLGVGMISCTKIGDCSWMRTSLKLFSTLVRPGGQRNAKDRVEVVRDRELLKDQRIDVGLRIDGEAAGRARGVEEVDVRRRAGSRGRCIAPGSRPVN